MRRGSNAIVDGNMVYIKPTESEAIFAYNSTNRAWDQLLDCPTCRCSLSFVNKFLVTTGGWRNGNVTNQLFSLTGEGESRVWTEMLPPMPTKREQAITVCCEQALIVAGGVGQNYKGLKTVEIMNTNTHQWSTAADLPQPLYSALAQICGYRIYILGGYRDDGMPTNTVYTCSQTDLLQSCRSKSLLVGLVERLIQFLSWSKWNKIADLPVVESTCVTLHDQLLAIGGRNSNYEPTSDIHIYEASSDQWESASNMMVARRQCFSAVLPDNELMVVGGYTHSRYKETDSVEIATIQTL